jgi:hypothetical protein
MPVDGICLLCGAFIEAPNAVAVNKIELEDKHNVKSSIEGNMYLCLECYAKVHANLEIAACL